MIDEFAAKVTSASRLEPANVYEPSVATDAGMESDCNWLLAKALLLRVVTDAGIT